nr:hypothetical protein CFP56_32200 [Quercus suber]
MHLMAHPCYLRHDHQSRALEARMSPGTFGVFWGRLPVAIGRSFMACVEQPSSCPISFLDQEFRRLLTVLVALRLDVLHDQLAGIEDSSFDACIPQPVRIPNLNYRQLQLSM